MNRGFVSEKEIVGTGAERRLKDAALVSGTTEFVALLPRVYPGNMFTPDNVPEKGSWFHVNPSQMAEWASSKAGVEALSLAPSASQKQDTDAYTPSAGVAESVKGMLGGSKESERVLPVYLEEVFGKFVHMSLTETMKRVPNADLSYICYCYLARIERR